ncbi:MAG: hypothetical protein JWM87_788 [Candidatus Eremiobacteraeota bacterium]|nr:hypothetical protein [Candidatus Eremiobacteraeota bacterium]
MRTVRAQPSDNDRAAFFHYADWNATLTYCGLTIAADAPTVRTITDCSLCAARARGKAS